METKMEDLLNKTGTFFMELDKATDPDSAGGTDVVLLETVPIALGAVGMIQPYAQFRQAWGEWQQKSDEEKKEVLDRVYAKFDLRNDRIEVVVEATLTFVAAGAKFFDVIRSVRKAEEVGAVETTLKLAS